MFARILIPTDGSPASTETCMAAIDFARQSGAELVGLFVAPKMQYPISIDTTPPGYVTDHEFRSSMLTVGETYLNEIRRAADKAEVRFSGRVVVSDATAETIVHTAEETGCDLIFMGSHGRSGWQQLLLGSVAMKVVALSSLPLLLYRGRAARESFG